MISSGADSAAWSWVAHLREGGSIPWAQWPPVGAPEEQSGDRAGEQSADRAGDRPGERASQRRDARLPGAAQLEVVRRLAARRAETRGDLDRSDFTRSDFTGLADLVLERSGPGRGPVEIPLADKGSPAGSSPTDLRPVGTPAVDPGRVPVSELLRVAVGALTELVLTGPAAAEPPAAPRRRPWSKAFRLAGPPVSTAALRAALAAAGRVEGGRRPTVLLVVGSVDDLLREAWTARAQRGLTLRWQKFVARWAREDRLPLPADLPVVAQHWAERVGAERVHLIASRDADQVRRTVADVLGLDALPPAPERSAEPAGLAAPGVDVLRRVNAVLNVRAAADRHPAAVRTAAALLGGPGPVRPLLVPERCAGWAEDRAAQMVGELRAGGYAVHGDLERVVSRREDGDDTVHPADVLDIALEACLRAAEQPGREWKVRRP